MGFRSVAISSFSKLKVSVKPQEIRHILTQDRLERAYIGRGQNGLDLVSVHTMAFLHLFFHFSMMGSSTASLM
jgi:hypothetical protein